MRPAGRGKEIEAAGRHRDLRRGERRAAGRMRHRPATPRRSPSCSAATARRSHAMPGASWATTAAPRTSCRRSSCRRCAASAASTGPAGFKPWLYRIAHNTCVDHMRRNRRGRGGLDRRRASSPPTRRSGSSAGAEHPRRGHQKEDFKNLREAFGGLPPAQSEVLVMRELEGLSYDEIALRAWDHARLRGKHAVPRPAGPAGRVRPDRDRRAVPAHAARDGPDGRGHRRPAGQAGARPPRCAAASLPARRVRDGPRRAGAGVAGTGLRGGLSRVAALLPLPWLIHRRADDRRRVLGRRRRRRLAGHSGADGDHEAQRPRVGIGRRPGRDGDPQGGRGGGSGGGRRRRRYRGEEEQDRGSTCC